MKENKIWGETEELWSYATGEVHRISAIAGGYSSIHKHESKYNYFYVESGELIIERWKNKNIIDKTTLKKGESTVVPPGEFHRFTAKTKTDAIEIYWVELNKKDITRRNQGGVKSVVKTR